MYINLEDIANRMRVEDLLGIADESGQLSETDVQDMIANENYESNTPFLQRVNEVIADACEMVDSYCASRYPVPFDTVPKIIKKVCAEIAIYYLYSYSPQEIPSGWQKRHESTIKFLQSVADGKISLGFFQASERTVNEARVVGNPRLFTRQSMRGF